MKWVTIHSEWDCSHVMKWVTDARTLQLSPRTADSKNKYMLLQPWGQNKFKTKKA